MEQPAKYMVLSCDGYIVMHCGWLRLKGPAVRYPHYQDVQQHLAVWPDDLTFRYSGRVVTPKGDEWYYQSELANADGCSVMLFVPPGVESRALVEADVRSAIRHHEDVVYFRRAIITEWKGAAGELMKGPVT